MHYFFKHLSPFLASSIIDNDGIGNVTDSVTSISEAIHNYGIAVVVMAVFFVIFLILVILVLRNNARLMDRLISSQTSHETLDQNIVEKLVNNALEAKDERDRVNIDDIANEFKNSLQSIESAIKDMKHDDSKNDNEEDYHKDLVGAYIDINMAFKDISRSTLNKLKCDRIGIYVFHNGNKSMLGLPFFKMSCIHEWTTHGNNTLRGKSHSDMPLHMFNDFIEDIWSSGVYKAENIETAASVDNSITGFTAFSNTKALYMVAIKDSDNAMTGFVVAEFDHVDTFEHDEERDKYVRNIIDNMVDSIAPIVSTKYIYRGHVDK